MKAVQHNRSLNNECLINITYSVWAIGLGYLLYKQPIKPITLLLTLLLSAGVIVTLYYKGEQK